EDPLEERDRVGVAAVDVVSDCNLGESHRAAIIGLGNEATISFASEAFIDPWKVFVRRFPRPKLAAELCPDSTVGNTHLPDFNQHMSSFRLFTAKRRHGL